MIPRSRLRDRTPTSPNSDRSQPPNFKRSQFQLIPKVRSLTTPILNDSYGALRYRTPTSPNAIAHNPNFKRSPIFLDSGVNADKRR